MRKRILPLVLVPCLILVLGACKKETSTLDPNAKPLKLSFADPAWDGSRIPSGQQCRRFGGSGKTPSIKVENVSPAADAIVIEYSDASYAPMNHGGHGKIGYRIDPGTGVVVVPSVPGHTFDLPQGFFLVRAHKNPSWDKAGAYMPPCSGGKGNRYWATVKTVKLTSEDGKDFEVIQEEDINLGRY